MRSQTHSHPRAMRNQLGQPDHLPFHTLAKSANTFVLSFVCFSWQPRSIGIHECEIMEEHPPNSHVSSKPILRITGHSNNACVFCQHILSNNVLFVPCDLPNTTGTSRTMESAPVRKSNMTYVVTCYGLTILTLGIYMWCVCTAYDKHTKELH